MPDPQKPPLDLFVDVITAEGYQTRWDAESPNSDNVPQNINFATRRGDGFADGGVLLSRRMDRDWPDLNLLDGLVLTGWDGSIAYEGRIGSMPRSLAESGQTIQVQTAGWMSTAKNHRIREIIVDRDFGHWATAPSVSRKAVLVGSAFNPFFEAQVTQDAGSGQPALMTQVTGDWSAKPVCEPIYDSHGIPIGSLYYAWKIAGIVSTDVNWNWTALLAIDDTLNGGLDSSGNLRAAGPGTGTLVATTATKTCAIVEQLYNLVPSTGHQSQAYPVFWTCLAVYGRHGLTGHGISDATHAPGFYASDVLRYLVGKYCPKLNTSGIQDTDYVIPHLVWLDPTFPFDAFTETNKFHRWDMGVFENRTFFYQPVDLTDYDWEVRLGDPGVTTTLQGDSTSELANGIEVSYTDLLTGTKRWITPATNSELQDPDIGNSATRHGEDIWTAIELSSPTTLDGAIQLGRLALAEFNQPKTPGQINVKGHIRDRQGHWQQTWKVRCGDRVAITDSTALSGRPRLIVETGYDHPGGLAIAVDSTFRRIDAVLDRFGSALTANNLSF